jgi:hypothetical protein
MSVLPQLERELIAAHRRQVQRRRFRGAPPISDRLSRYGLPRTMAAIPVAFALLVTLAVAVVALSLHHGSTKKRAAAASPGIAGVVAEAPDPQAGAPWALQISHRRNAVCLHVGRLLPAKGPLGQRVFADADQLAACTATDAHGHAFLNVFERDVRAWPGKNGAIGKCALGAWPAFTSPCPREDLRNLAYGLLGPSATSVTYVVNGHSVTKRTTGPDGAYLIVLPGTAETCHLTSIDGHPGRGCEHGAAQISSTALMSGVITAVTYSNGHVCHLPSPTPRGTRARSCRAVGYANRPQNIAPAHLSTTLDIRRLLEGNGIASISFGQPRSRVVAELERLLGPPHETIRGICGYGPSTDWIGLNINPKRVPSQVPSAALTLNFKGSTFVGYTYDENAGWVARQRDGVLLATARGLTLGDTVARARNLYGRAFTQTRLPQGTPPSAKLPRLPVGEVSTAKGEISAGIQGSGRQDRVTADSTVTSIGAGAGPNTPCR